jgi:hypothetical protein
VLDTLNEQGQLTLEHEIDLLLLLMRMYAPPLVRLEHDQVHPKGAHTQLAPQRLEALATITVKGGKGDVKLSHRASIGH